ncbi:MAG: hypothetical protein QG646_1999 [Euryarchaeota archaeon]|nr:hypothetical protein [Euryarchaeota archaeon]
MLLKLVLLFHIYYNYFNINVGNYYIIINETEWIGIYIISLIKIIVRCERETFFHIPYPPLPI